MTSARPLIGLSGRRKPAHDVAGFPSNMADHPIDVYVAAYAHGVTEAGGLPVHLPIHVDPAEFATVLDGVVLTGGADLDPATFGGGRPADAYPVEPERDAFELALVEAAVGGNVPVLGICRGLQILNVWGGGTLLPDIPPHARYDLEPGAVVDEVTFSPDSRLHSVYGERRAVNSLHHQAVDRVADGWVVVGRGRDGTVEAMEWPGHDIVAVQWHPEMMAAGANDPVFGWLVERAAERAQRRQGAARV